MYHKYKHLKHPPNDTVEISHESEADKKNTTFFSSPHLVDMRHRIWLKNRFITLNEIKSYEKIISKTGLKLTLFEVITVIYLLAANDQKKISYKKYH